MSKKYIDGKVHMSRFEFAQTFEEYKISNFKNTGQAMVLWLDDKTGGTVLAPVVFTDDKGGES